MTAAEQIAADVAARIKEADDYAHRSAICFAVGRFDEEWVGHLAPIVQRLEEAGKVITDAADTYLGPRPPTD